MIQPYRPFLLALSLSAFTFSLLVAGCNKKPVSKSTGVYAPPASMTKPTVTLSADKTSLNPGESAKLSWTSTDATNVSIAPEVGAVTAQGTTTVTPASSTTYTITASGPGGNADATVRISVNTPTTTSVAPAAESSIDKLFLEEVSDAYFDYDSAELRPDARQAIQKDAAFFKQYPTMRITIEGHCDERGSTEYNLALGQRRANAVMQYLVSVGIPEGRLSATSWGKEKPFCMEATEACYAKNRRGHFVQTK
jgi:peptidoglycan-associated lipoprotein